MTVSLHLAKGDTSADGVETVTPFDKLADGVWWIPEKSPKKQDAKHLRKNTVKRYEKST